MGTHKISVLLCILYLTTGIWCSGGPFGYDDYEGGFVCEKTSDGIGDELRGPPGPPGMKGRQGKKGDRGISGKCECDADVDAIIDEKVKQALAKMDKKEKVCKGFTTEGKCYWVILPGKMISHDKSIAKCVAEGGTPANIYSQRQLTDTMAYIRSKTSTLTYVYTGMSFSSSNGVLSNYDGSAAKFTTGWRSGDPRYTVSYEEMEHVAIDVHQDPSDPGNGMLTAATNWEKMGVVCEEQP